MRPLQTTTDLLDSIRVRNGWNDDVQLSAGVDVPQSTVSGWRTGRMRPTEVHALKLAAAAGISPLVVLAIAAAERLKGKDRRAWMAIALSLQEAA